MELDNITEYKRLAYLRYKKLDTLFEQLKDLTFIPANVIKAVEELRSEKGFASFQNFTDDRVLKYLTSEEQNEYQKLKSLSENKEVVSTFKKANNFILYDWHNGNAYCFNKSSLKNIYELNIIRAVDKKYVKDMLDYTTPDTYIVKIKDYDLYNDKICITFLDNYDDINVKLGSEKYIFFDTIAIKDKDNKDVDKSELTINDIVFLKPIITPNDAKNIIIPEIDDKDLIFELTLQKTDNLLHALQTNGVNIPSLSNKNYELRVAYDIEKNEFSIYDTKSKTASFKNEFTNFIKSNTDLSNTI